MTETTTGATSDEELRRKHVAHLGSLLPEMLERLTWPAERLAAHRTGELRRLLRVAREASPWHRERLRGIEIDAIEASDLTALPVMTKDDLMTHFDAIVTDERLRLDVVEDHLAGPAGSGYLFGRYHAVASGGSSGRRGVIVYDWDGWAMAFVSMNRHQIRVLATDPVLAGAPPVMAIIASAAPHHASASLPQTFSNPDNVIHRFPVDLPIAAIVDELNAVQPTLLWGYASVMHALAVEGSAGRLHISPRWVGTLAEPLLPETRALLEQAFGVPVGNSYGASEVGGIANPCRSGPWPHLADDLLIVEPVDAAGRAVPPGTRCDRMYVTNLYNHAQPFIRYELTDQITLLEPNEPCPCGSTHRRISDPYGRLDDVFGYDGLTVHPHVFRTPLSRHSEVIEYQVRQIPSGATISIVVAAPCDTAVLAAEVAAGLARAGLAGAEVHVDVVDRLPRPASGKLRRFVPMTGASHGGSGP